MTETTVRARRSSGATYRPYLSPLSATLVRSPLQRRPGTYAISTVSLIASDLIAIVAALAVTAAFSRNPHSLHQLPGILSIAIAWIGARYIAGLYPAFGTTPPEALRLNVITTLLAGIAYSAAFIPLHAKPESRMVAVGSWLLLLPLSVCLRGIVKALLVKHRLFGRPVVVFGAGNTGAFIIQELLRDAGLGLVPVAAFDDDPAKHGSTVFGVPILGDVETALTWRTSYEVDHAVIAIRGVNSRRLVQLSEHISRRYGSVSLVADTIGLGNLWVRPQAFGRCLTLSVNSPRFSHRHLTVKRVTDLAIAVPAFILALPVILIAAGLVALIDGGTPFYFQNREGIGGRRIKVWKIRSMARNAEEVLQGYLDANQDARAEWNNTMKLRNDPRIIPYIGSFIRRSSIDELPQFWNVLIGEMSLVGPRPLPDYHLEKFEPEFLALRRQVKPGISGYWQVTERSDSDIAGHQASDRFYIENWSLWLDLWVIIRTVEAVILGHGAV